MLLSVCLIAKNEERFLPGALASVREVADEIVLVDTGSADRTVEIAREHGCRVLHETWRDDYSAARNAGIAAARGRFILCLDADERLVHPETLREALLAAPAEVGGYFLERHDRVIRPEDGEPDVYPIGMLRLFRNHTEIRYEGIVHERPNDAVLRAGFTVGALAPVHLIHLVSDLPYERLVEKQRRYLRLLDLTLSGDPNDFWARYYRGKTIWFLGRRDEAKAAFRAIADASTCGRPLRASALSMLATLLAESGDRPAAVACIEESLALVPGASLALYVLAETLYADGHYAAARVAYARVRRSLDPTAGPPAVPGDLCLPPGKRAYKLGCCNLAEGDLAAAEQDFHQGLLAEPDHAGCWYGLARTVLAQGNSTEAIEHLRQAITAAPTWRTPRDLYEQVRAGA
ncbi:MAG TPA: glycosyltransferase [Thermoanaerobaculia bacterium]|jgi:tetratricopeptide (TPR) repeat protein|nr:glycosyltransferase [Thermoanaerobaculia bacterium]